MNAQGTSLDTIKEAHLSGFSATLIVVRRSSCPFAHGLLKIRNHLVCNT